MLWKGLHCARITNTHLQRRCHAEFVHFQWHHSLWRHLECVLPGSAESVHAHLQSGTHFSGLQQLQCKIELVVVLWNAIFYNWVWFVTRMWGLTFLYSLIGDFSFINRNIDISWTILPRPCDSSRLHVRLRLLNTSLGNLSSCLLFLQRINQMYNWGDKH